MEPRSVDRAPRDADGAATLASLGDRALTRKEFAALLGGVDAPFFQPQHVTARLAAMPRSLDAKAMCAVIASRH